MTTQETILKLVDRFGKEKVGNAIGWIAKEAGAKTRDEALEALLNVDYDKVIEYKSSSYICKDKSSAYDRTAALFTSNALANYIEQELA